MQKRGAAIQRIWGLLAVIRLCGVAVGQTIDQSSQLSPVPGTGVLKPADTASFSFIAAGDSRPANPDLPLPATAGQMFASARSLKPAFTVWTGDAILGLNSADPVMIGKQYQAFFKVARKAGVPVFLAPGNHEMDVTVSVQNSNVVREVGSAQMEALYRKNMELPVNAPTYGAFTYGNSRFILLDSEEIPQPDTERSPHAKVGAGGEVNLDPGFISPTQFQWLKQQLDTNKAVHTFIFMHHPIKPKTPDMGLNRENAEALMKLFSRYSNISYVLASHEHLYYNPQTSDTRPPPNRIDPSNGPPFYLVSGGGGPPVEGTPENGGFHHYLKFQIDRNQVQVHLLRLT
jgi:hypothetical protein